MDPKKRTRRVQEFGVGVVVLAALVLLAAGILAIGRENKLFARRVGYVTIVDDAAGLRAGSPVAMNGVRIGSVDRITLPADPASNGIRLRLGIDAAYRARVREGTQARLAILQVVANEKVVALTPGDPHRPVLPPESMIPPAEASPLLQTGKNIAETVEQATGDLREILAAIKEGRGLLGKAIVDPEFARDTADRFARAVDSTERLLARLEHGEGLAGRLLGDRDYGRQVTGDLARAAASLARIAARIDDGQGLLGQATARGPGDDLLRDLGETARGLREVTAAVRSGDGLAGMLLTDKERARRVADQLDRATASLASVLRKVDEGQGTLGQLVNARTLHDDAEQLLTGARRSAVLSWIIRHFYRRGASDAPSGG